MVDDIVGALEVRAWVDTCAERERGSAWIVRANGSTAKQQADIRPGSWQHSGPAERLNIKLPVNMRACRKLLHSAKEAGEAGS